MVCVYRYSRGAQKTLKERFNRMKSNLILFRSHFIISFFFFNFSEHLNHKILWRVVGLAKYMFDVTVIFLVHLNASFKAPLGRKYL